ncbi:MAG TPA: response regulator [bacterium]
MRTQLPAFNRPKVLVVEDNPLVRQVSVGLLELLNCEVSQAEDAQGALKLLMEGEQYDLLFTDIVMPGEMNGFGLAEAVRLCQPQLKVLFTSGYTREALPMDSTVIPDCQVLSKPYGLAQLTAALQALLPERMAVAS